MAVVSQTKKERIFPANLLIHRGGAPPGAAAFIPTGGMEVSIPSSFRNSPVFMGNHPDRPLSGICESDPSLPHRGGSLRGKPPGLRFRIIFSRRVLSLTGRAPMTSAEAPLAPSYILVLNFSQHFCSAGKLSVELAVTLFYSGNKVPILRGIWHLKISSEQSRNL